MNRSTLVRLLAVLAIVVVAVVLAIRFDLPSLMREMLDWVQGQGAVGVIVFTAVYILATVLFIPGSILTLGAGFVYGVVMGTAYVSVASTLGAFAAFLVGRYAARGFVEQRVAENARFAAIDRAVAREGWKIVLLTRLAPVFPFNLLNYAYGLTAVRPGSYFLASWIGMLPGTVMYVYFGSLAADLATLGGAAEGRSTIEWIARIVGFAIAILVTVYVTRLARNALKQSTDIEGEAQ